MIKLKGTLDKPDQGELYLDEYVNASQIQGFRMITNQSKSKLILHINFSMENRNFIYFDNESRFSYQKALKNCQQDIKKICRKTN